MGVRLLVSCASTFVHGRGLVLAAVFALCGAAHAEHRMIGDWSLDVWKDGTEAQTGNESGATFGYLCHAGACSFYLNLNATCGTDGSRTSMLVNAESGSTNVMTSCVNLTVNGTTRHLNAFRGKDILASIASGSSISFALPMQGGQFKVVRFSLDGASAATQSAATAAQNPPKSRPSPGSDWNI